MSTIFLSIGTNLGNKEANLKAAIDAIAEAVGNVEAQSDFIATQPWGFDSDNTFLNAAVRVTTDLNPYEVLAATQQIERRMGRAEKSVKHEYHDRIIDIDILLYIEQGVSISISSPSLTIPHPLMWQRDFVLTPLKQIL